MDIQKAWYFLKDEPQAFAKQLLPQALHALNKKLSSYTRGLALYPPRRLLIALTTRCDLRCKMCPLWGKEGLWFKETPGYFKGELEAEELDKLAKEIGPYQPAIILTGGEPLMTPTWYAFAQKCKSYGCRVFMATGATLLAKKAELVLKTIDHLQVSFDGFTSEIHDRNRGREGSFQKVVAGIEKIHHLKQKHKLKKPFINICSTITDENYEHLLSFVHFLESLNIKINELAFQHLEFTDKKTLKRHQKFYQHYFGKETNFWEGFLYYPEKNFNLDRLLLEIKRVMQHKKKENINRILFRPDLTIEEVRVFYSSGFQLPPRYDRKCLAPWQEAFIMPNGDVWTCPDYIAGNIKKEPFLSIWNNSQYRLLRQVLNRTATMPACKTCASLYVH